MSFRLQVLRKPPGNLSKKEGCVEIGIQVSLKELFSGELVVR